MPVSSVTTKNKHPVVRVKEMTVAYGDEIAVQNITFDIQRGDIVAIIGPNGSGKTTVLKGILGLAPLQKGEVRIFGQPIDQVRNRIGYVPQRFDFDRRFPITVGEFMDFTRRPTCPAEKCVEKIKEVGLKPDILERRLGSLSGGQLQRVMVAQAILEDPDLLILDEPVSGIDIAGEAAFYDILKHLNEVHDATILMVSHDLTVVSSLVNNVICINKDLMCSGPPQKELTSERLAEVFGHHASFFGHEIHANPDIKHKHLKNERKR